MIPNVINVTNSGKEAGDLLSYNFAKNREVYLFSEINDSVALEIIAQLEYLNRKGKDDIKLYINSPGGAVTAGLAIIDCINRLKCDVCTIGTGICASMGALLLVCGTKGKRFVTPTCEVMIHQPLGGTQGQATDIEIASKHIHKTKKLIYGILSKRTEKSLKQIAKDCERDHYMSSAEAIAYGIADAVYN